MEVITGRAAGILFILIVFGAIFGIPQLVMFLRQRSKKGVEHDEDDDDPPAPGGLAVPV